MRKKRTSTNLVESYTQQLRHSASQASQATQAFQATLASQALASRRTISRGAREYVIEHWEQSLHEAEQSYGKQGRLFHFVRALKAHEDFASVEDGLDALGAVDAAICGKLDSNDSSDFVKLWHTVKVPLGWTHLDVAAGKAREEPLWPVDPRMPDYSVFKDVVAWLWKTKSDYLDIIFFSCRAMAKCVGCSPKTISNYCWMAEREGYLQCTKRGKQGPASKEASEFVVDLSMIHPEPILRVMKGGGRR